MKYLGFVVWKDGKQEIISAPSLYKLRQKKAQLSSPRIDSIQIIKPGKPLPLGMRFKGVL